MPIPKPTGFVSYSRHDHHQNSRLLISVESWITSPFIATYSASKHADLVVTDAARIQLRSQGTQVLGVYAGYIDTDMATHIGSPKISPMDVARRTLESIEAGIDHVLADERAHDIWQTRCSDPGALEAAMQNNWDHNLR